MHSFAPVLAVVLPVYALVTVGWAARRAGVIAAADVGRMSRFTFVVFVPALLFGAMARTDFAAMQPAAPAVYFTASLALFFAVVLVRRRRVPAIQAAVEGLAASFSNTVMIGVPLVALGWGDDGLSVLLSIIALNALLLLTTATFVLEVAAATGTRWIAVGRAIRESLTHPVILPILAGAAWRLTGLPMPAAVHATLGLLSAAAVPLCLVLLGASLDRDALRASLRPALGMTVLKLVAMPALAALVGTAVIGLSPLALSIVVLAAALPIGANVFLFAQRYGARTTPVPAAVAWSTLLAAPTLALLLPVLPVPPR